MKLYIGALREAVSPKVQKMDPRLQRQLAPVLRFGATDDADAEEFFRQYMLRLYGLNLGSCGHDDDDEFGVGTDGQVFS